MRKLSLAERDLRALASLTSMIEPRPNRLILISLDDIDCVVTPTSLWLMSDTPFAD